MYVCSQVDDEIQRVLSTGFQTWSMSIKLWVPENIILFLKVGSVYIGRSSSEQEDSFYSTESDYATDGGAYSSADES